MKMSVNKIGNLKSKTKWNSQGYKNTDRRRTIEGILQGSTWGHLGGLKYVPPSLEARQGWSPSVPSPVNDYQRFQVLEKNSGWNSLVHRPASLFRECWAPRMHIMGRWAAQKKAGQVAIQKISSGLETNQLTKRSHKKFTKWLFSFSSSHGILLIQGVKLPSGKFSSCHDHKQAGIPGNSPALDLGALPLALVCHSVQLDKVSRVLIWSAVPHLKPRKELFHTIMHDHAITLAWRQKELV